MTSSSYAARNNLGQKYATSASYGGSVLGASGSKNSAAKSMGIGNSSLDIKTTGGGSQTSSN